MIEAPSSGSFVMVVRGRTVQRVCFATTRFCGRLLCYSTLANAAFASMCSIVVLAPMAAAAVK